MRGSSVPAEGTRLGDAAMQQHMVRTATVEDLAEVESLVADWPEAPRWSRAAWELFCNAPVADDPVQRVLLLDREVVETGEGSVRGLLAATMFDRESELELLLVRPDLRRRGVGRGLVQRWLAWARAQRAEVAFLEVRASNVEARALYATAGFCEVGRRRAYYHDPVVEDAMQMRCALQG